MIMIQTGGTPQASNPSTEREETLQAGPIFVPPRRPSAFARQLMQESAGVGEAVTAYDEMWFTGRPTV